MQYPEYVETNEFNFWNYKSVCKLEYLDNNLNLNNYFCTYIPPIDAENYEIFQNFMQDRIQNPTFFFHELFPLLKFSEISFIFLYNTYAEESLVLANCKAMVVVFKENDKLDCYTFTKEVLGNTNDSVIYFLGIVEYREPEMPVEMHDSTELGSFYECISRMKERVVAKGLYFPSGFAEMLPEGDYSREDFLNKFETIEKYKLNEDDIKEFFIIFFYLRFPNQIKFFNMGIFLNNSKVKRIDRIEFGDIDDIGLQNNNPRFVVFTSSVVDITKLESDEGKDATENEYLDSHETKILIDRKFKKIVFIDSAVNVTNDFSLRDFKNLFAAKLLEENITDITTYSVEESIVSFLNNDFYENIPKDQVKIPPSESNKDEEYEPEDTEIYYRGNDGPRNREAPSVMYLQIMFEQNSTVKYKNYCDFISWWMLFIILKLNEYNWRSFTQIAGDDLNKLVKEKNKDFIGNILFLTIKTIKDPRYKRAIRNKNNIGQEQIIRENFILQNVLDLNQPASRFGCESAKKK